MKLHELLLLEYRRDITQQKLAKELDIIANNEGMTPEDVLVQVESIDPTKNKQYVLWLVKQLVKKQFRFEDASRVTELLKNFISVKSRLPLDQRDIGRFDFYGLDDLIDKTMNVELEKDTATNSGTFPVVPDSKVLYNGPLGQLSVPETEAASCELGRGTKWCTAAEKDNYFSEYNMHGPLYVWRDKSGEKYQFHFEGGNYEDPEFKDARDRPIDQKTIGYFRKQHPVLSKLFAKKEAEMIKGGQFHKIVGYARDVLRDRWPEAEPAILTNPAAIKDYAQDVLKRRWPEGESVVMKSPEAAVGYAYSVIGSRWPEAEPYIMKDPLYAKEYARLVIGKRWKEAEPYIMKSDAAVDYVDELIKKRWPEAEPYIMKSDAAAHYAERYIKKRWPEAEPYIMQNPWAALAYAKNIIKGRWKEAEPELKNNPFVWSEYTKAFPDAG